MVKLQFSIIRKRYLKGKHEYRYERISLSFPARFNEVVKPFLNRDLKIEVKVEGETLRIALTKHKDKEEPKNEDPKAVGTNPRQTN